MYRFHLHSDVFGSMTLKTPPVNWQDLEFIFKRDKQYHGISVEANIETTFVLEGRDYLKKAFARDGIEAKVQLQIESYNTNTFVFETIYTGRISFKRYEDQDSQLTVGVDAEGFTRQFLNLDDVEVNLQKLESVNGISLTAYQNELTSLQLHSKEIIKKYEAFGSTELNTSEVTVTGNTNEHTNKFATISFGFTDVKVNELGANSTVLGFSLDQNLFEHLKAKESGPATLEYNIDVAVKCELDWEVDGVSGTFGKGDFDIAELKIFYGQTGHSPVELYNYYQNPVNGDFYREVKLSGSRQLNLNVDDKVFLYGQIKLSDFSGNLIGDYEFRLSIVESPNSYIRITANTQTPATNARGVMVHEAFSRIIDSISDNQIGFYSDFFGRTDSSPRSYAVDGSGGLHWQSNGFQIRNFPISNTYFGGKLVEGKPVFASFRKLFDGYDAIYNLGAGFEQINDETVLRIEPKRHFYQNVVGVALGCVANLKTTIATERYYNQAEFGYQQWQIEDTNGLDEFNAKQTSLLPITQEKKTYSALSGLIASGYMLETTRRKQFVDASTKDDRSDNNLFVVSVLRSGSGFETERNQNLTTLENVISPSTVYNVRLSPARMRRRHGNILSASMLKQAGELKFNNGEGNYYMRSRFTNEAAPITENESLPASEIESPIWENEYYEFEYPVNKTLSDQIKANLYKQLSFQDEEGETHYGYLEEMKHKPTAGTGDFKLIKAYR